MKSIYKNFLEDKEKLISRVVPDFKAPKIKFPKVTASIPESSPARINDYEPIKLPYNPNTERKITKLPYKPNTERKITKFPGRPKDDFLDGFTYYDDDFEISKSSKITKYSSTMSPGQKALNTFNTADEFLKGFTSSAQEEEEEKKHLSLFEKPKDERIVTAVNYLKNTTGNTAKPGMQKTTSQNKSEPKNTPKKEQKSDAALWEEYWEESQSASPTAKSTPKTSQKSNATILEEYWEESQNTGKPKTEDEWVSEICKDVPGKFESNASKWAELSDINEARKGNKNSKWYQRLEKAWSVGDLEVYEKVEKMMDDQEEKLENELKPETSYRDYWTNLAASVHNKTSVATENSFLSPIFKDILGLGNAQSQENLKFNMKNEEISNYYIDKNGNKKEGYIEDQNNGAVGKLKYGVDTMSKNGCGIIAVNNALVTLGNTKDIREIIPHFERKGEVFWGKFGTNHYSIKEYFENNGYRVTAVNGDEEIYLATAGNVPKADVYILTYWHPDFKDGMHTISINKKANGSYETHNESDVKNADTLYDIVSLIEGIPTSLICISK